MASIMPLRRPTPPTTPVGALDVGFIAYVLDVTDPDLFADYLDGETGDERAARQAAAADITDDLALEYGAETAVLALDFEDGLEAVIAA